MPEAEPGVLIPVSVTPPATTVYMEVRIWVSPTSGFFHGYYEL